MDTMRRRRQPSFTAVQKISTTEEILYQPRTVSPLFDDKLASKWLHACKTNHQESYGLPSPVDVAITLIDCFTRDIRPSRTPEKYAALSYVWGGAKQSPLSTEGRLPEDLSAVIKDAMAVTQALGLQYLWVDLYCIDQKDEAAKKRQMLHKSTILPTGRVDHSSCLRGQRCPWPRWSRSQPNHNSKFSIWPVPLCKAQ